MRALLGVCLFVRVGCGLVHVSVWLHGFHARLDACASDLLQAVYKFTQGTKQYFTEFETHGHLFGTAVQIT
jgi:hypothetical protein